jgi:hypothetical protein
MVYTPSVGCPAYEKVHAHHHPVLAHSLADQRYLQAMKKLQLYKRGEGIPSHREIIRQEDLTLVVVKI